MRLTFVSLALILSLSASCGNAPPAPLISSTIPDQGPFLAKTLAAYSNRYWARVAGRDTGLPPHINGHDEFAAQWTKDILASLHGLHAGVFRQAFATPGFKKLPSKRPGVNVVVAVPGSRHPEQALVVGAHYDGEPSSKGSANDDASGSVIMLGLARVLGGVWRAKGLPSMTVEFVLFDAEEQGLIGSFYFTHAYRQGSVMPRPVLMINEEQSGVAYPVRPFGLQSQPVLPSFASTVDRLPPVIGKPKPIDPSETDLLLSRLTGARATIFPQMHAAYSPMSYRGGNESAFSDADQQHLEIGPSGECCSDNDPFQREGIPNVTFSGNYDFYTGHASPWSFPFDQPWDTMTALACDTGGSPIPSRALRAALNLPMAMSALVVQMYAPSAPGRRVVAFSTLARVGADAHFRAIGSGKVHWDFGDGSSSTKPAPTHTYRRAGTYHVQLRSGRAGTSFTLSVATSLARPHYPFGAITPPRIRPWHPGELQNITGCN